MEEAAVAPLVERLAQALEARRWTLATAESCTGGLLAAACTERPGSSAWFERGWVTYSNAAKREALGVDAGLIERHGAVSAEVATAMAEGALAHSAADVAVSITGVAGPGGGSLEKPVGTVWLAVAARGAGPARAERILAPGDRAAVRRAAVGRALAMLLAALAP